MSDERVLDAFVTDGARVMAAESMSVLKTIGDVYFQLRVKLLTSSTPKHFLKSPLSWRVSAVSLYIQWSCDCWLRGPAVVLVMCLQKCLFKV